jgi:hypothetical protein
MSARSVKIMDGRLGSERFIIFMVLLKENAAKLALRIRIS